MQFGHIFHGKKSFLKFAPSLDSLRRNTAKLPAFPMDPVSKTGPVDGCDGMMDMMELMDVQVLQLVGEALTLRLPTSLLGRDVWKAVAKQIPSKAGAKLMLQVVSTQLPLLLHQTLKEQDFSVSTPLILACVYVPNVCDACRFLQGFDVLEQDFVLEGVTELRGLTTSKCLDYLPESLKDLSFGNRFNPDLQNVSWPRHLRSLTFPETIQRKLKKGRVAGWPWELDFWCWIQTELGECDLAKQS